MFTPCIRAAQGCSRITLHTNPSPRYDSNYWLCNILLDPALKVVGQDDVYKETVKGAIARRRSVTHRSQERAH